MSVSVLVLQTHCPPLCLGGNSKARRKHCPEPRHVVVSACGVLIPDGDHQGLALHDKLLVVHHKLELRIKVWFDVLVKCSSLVVANLELAKPCMRIMEVDKGVGVL